MGLYTQLTQKQRYQIYAFLKAGFSQSAIASEINVHKSTICRELKRETFAQPPKKSMFRSRFSEVALIS